MPPKAKSPRRRANGGEGSIGVQPGGEPSKHSRPRAHHQTVSGRIVHRPDGLSLIVQLQELDGTMTVDVRLHRRGASGIAPTARGFRLGLVEAEALERALSEIIAAATGHADVPD